MKILFTNSPLHHTHSHVFLQPDWQTLVLPILAGIVGDKHEVRLVDNMRLRFKSNKILEHIQEFGPDVVGFSIIAAVDIYRTINIIKQVRQKYPGIILLAGGQAGSYYRELLIKNGVDFVVQGEGELTLKELITAINDGVADYSKIQGISYAADGAIQQTDPRSRLTNLNDTPFPAIHLMPSQKSEWFPGRFTGAIETARGCPFDCHFCAITAFWGRTYREKSNERAMEELRILKHYGRTHVYIIDDSFGVNARRKMELFGMMLRENLDMKWFTQIGVTTITNNPEMMKMAARAGMYGGLVGFDTYEPGTFSDVGKTSSIELNIKASEIMRENNIAILGSHIYALPSQKGPLGFKNTFWLGRKHSDSFRMPLFTPHPGTKLYQELSEKKLIKPEEGHDASRLLVGSASYRRKMTYCYYIYYFIHNILPDEFLSALFNRNKVIRKFKFNGYVMAFKFIFYQVLNKLRLSDI